MLTKQFKNINSGNESSNVFEYYYRVLNFQNKNYNGIVIRNIGLWT